VAHCDGKREGIYATYRVERDNHGGANLYSVGRRIVDVHETTTKSPASEDMAKDLTSSLVVLDQ
jgi:hypothetical protein